MNWRVRGQFIGGKRFNGSGTWFDFNVSHTVFLVYGMKIYTVTGLFFFRFFFIANGNYTQDPSTQIYLSFSNHNFDDTLPTEHHSKEKASAILNLSCNCLLHVWFYLYIYVSLKIFTCNLAFRVLTNCGLFPQNFFSIEKNWWWQLIKEKKMTPLTHTFFFYSLNQ